MITVVNSVLVVEDNPVFGLMFEIMLKRRGFEVRRVTDGRALQELVQTAPPPSAVLLDLSLPYVDGYHLLQMIRTSTKWAPVPVVVISGHAKASDRTRALTAGATDYFVKPLEVEAVLARLQQLLPGVKA